MEQNGWVDKLKNRWNLQSAQQVFLVLLVFACTGTTVLFIKRPITAWLYQDGQASTWFTVLYWLLILPIYNLLLLIYGFIFGQFRFFWEFERRFFRRMLGRK